MDFLALLPLLVLPGGEGAEEEGVGKSLNNFV